MIFIRANTSKRATAQHVPPVVFLPLFGAKVTPVDRNNLYSWIDDKIVKNDKVVIAAHNLHSLYLRETDNDFRTFSENADLVLVDGFPILQLARWATKLKLSKKYRLGSLDWVPALLTYTSVRKLAVVGSSPNANAQSVAILARTKKECTVRGWPGQGWDAEQATTVVNDLRDFRPDVVIIGLGMPLQEHFLVEHWDSLPESVYAVVGGAIDQISGAQKPAPRWLGPLGLEWLWRLVSQPKRLAHRYLIEPWILAALIARRGSRRLRHKA